LNFEILELLELVMFGILEWLLVGGNLIIDKFILIIVSWYWDRDRRYSFCLMCAMINPEFDILIYQNMQRISEQMDADCLSSVSMFHAFLFLFFLHFLGWYRYYYFFLLLFFFLVFLVFRTYVFLLFFSCFFNFFSCRV
jgi:hypothetical protein